MSYPYPHFLLHPNFHILSEYLSDSRSAEELHTEFANGYEIVVNRYHTDDLIKSVECRFRKILEKYDLIDHYDNLLMLALDKLNEIEKILDELCLQNEQQLRTKQLAGLLLAHKEAEERTYNSLSLKTTSRFNTVKVDDKKTINWILSIVHDGIRDGKFGSIGDIAFGIANLFFDDTETGKVINNEKLKKEASKPIASYKKEITAYNADFCLHLYWYLDGETAIRPDKNTFVSDEMCNFFFELLVLFELKDPDKISSDAKDYVRSLLTQRAKVLYG